MKLLFIAPLPPPLTGQSLVSRILLSELKKDFATIELNYSRENALKQSRIDFGFIRKVLRLGKIIKKNKRSADLVYFTITQSFLGNLKDLYFLFKIGKKLRTKTIIHLHGGHFDVLFNNSNPLIKSLNHFFFRDLFWGIVLGESLKKCFMQVLNENKIVAIPNFYEDEIIISDEEMKKKWSNPQKINLLFLSNLMEEKGYNELFDGFISLEEETLNKFELFFAGDFETDENKNLFLNKISGYENISYCGIVTGKEKIDFLHKSHCFILPTYYKIEGQPITILESYAAGLAVFTTDQGGIKDIFADGINGTFIEKKSSASITKSLSDFILDFEKYRKIAFCNHEYSANFRKDFFISRIKEVIVKITG